MIKTETRHLTELTFGLILNRLPSYPRAGYPNNCVARLTSGCLPGLCLGLVGKATNSTFLFGSSPCPQARGSSSTSCPTCSCLSAMLPAPTCLIIWEGPGLVSTRPEKNHENIVTAQNQPHTDPLLVICPFPH